VALVSSIYMFGLMIGSTFYGLVSDHFGRKTSMYISLVNVCVAGMAGAWVDNYGWYCFTRFLTGAGMERKGLNYPFKLCLQGGVGILMSAFNISLELAGNRTKSFCGIHIETPFAVGEALVAVIAIKVGDWRDLHVIDAKSCTCVFTRGVALVCSYGLRRHFCFFSSLFHSCPSLPDGF